MKFNSKFASLIVFFLLTGFVSAQQTDRDRGIDLYRVGDFTGAMTLLENAVTTDASDRAAWIFLGGVYVHTGEESKAVQAFAKMNVRPTNPQPTYDRSVKVTYKPHAPYTEEARKNLSSGKVRIAVEFRADGTIGFIFPLPTTIDPSLVEQSVNAAKSMKFEPAAKDGKPVTAINLVEYGFSVGRRPVI